jgi:DNA-binding GntR family transcriptional regulator
LGDRTYAQLKQDVITCELAPGQEVTESQLAERYQVGKAPVRSSLTRLRQEGLVEPLARRGYVISPFTMRDVHELYDARLAVETQCARRAAGRIDTAQLELLDREVSVGYTPGDRPSEVRFVEANRRIHLTIAAASGNSRLVDIVSGLLLQCDRVIHLAMRVATDAEHSFRHGHQRIIDALQSGDADRSAAELEASITGGRELIVQVLLASPSLMSTELRLTGQRDVTA